MSSPYSSSDSSASPSVPSKAMNCTINPFHSNTSNVNTLSPNPSASPHTNNIASVPLVIQPQMLIPGSFQCFVHPSMPNTPLILIPNYNALKTNNNGNNATNGKRASHHQAHANGKQTNNGKNNQAKHKQTTRKQVECNNRNTASGHPQNSHNGSTSSDSDYTMRIKQILEKFRSNVPLSGEESVMLQNAVQSARQQFLLWYQQQLALQQARTAVAAANNNNNNNNNSSNDKEGSPPPMTSLQHQQQQQLLAAQAYQIQQQLMQGQIIQQLQQQQQIMKQQQRKQQVVSQNHVSIQPAASAMTNTPWMTPTNAHNLSGNSPLQLNALTSLNGFASAHSDGSVSNGYSSNNKQTYSPKSIDWRTYFALPKYTEFDKIFVAEDSEHDDDDLIALTGYEQEQYLQVPQSNEDFDFNVEIEGLGTFEFGPHRIKREEIDKQKHKSLAPWSTRSSSVSPTVRESQDRLYELLRVKDVSSECCQWLIKDLIQCQTQNRMKSLQEQQLQRDKCNVLMHVANSPSINGMQPELARKTMNYIKEHPIVPRILLNLHIHRVCCSKNELIEISNVDLSYANVQTIAKTEKQDNAASKQDEQHHLEESVEEHTELNTLGFVELCEVMHRNMDPTEFAHILPISVDDKECDQLFSSAANILKQNPKHFGDVPSIPIQRINIVRPHAPPPPPPPDRKLFGTKMNQHNIRNQPNANTTPKSQQHRKTSPTQRAMNDMHPKRTNQVNQPQAIHPTANLQHTNSSLPAPPSIPAVNVNNACPANHPWKTHNILNIPSYTPLQFMNPIQINPQNVNAMNTATPPTQPLYGLPPPYIPSFAQPPPPTNVPNTASPSLRTPRSNQVRQMPTQQRRKMPNPTSWNIGNL